MKISINLKSIGWTIVFLILLKPDFWEYFHLYIIDTIIDFTRVLIALSVYVSFFYKKSKEKFVFFSVLFQVLIVCSTILNHGDIKSSIVYAAAYCSIIILGSWIVEDRTILKGLFYALSIYIYINFILIVFYPQGWYSGGAQGTMQWCWLLGYKTNFPLYIVPFICVAWLYYESSRNASYLIAGFIAGIQVFMVKTAGGIIAISIVFLCFILNRRTLFFRKVLSFGKVIIGYIIANIALLFFRVYLYFGDFFYRVLGKEKTLSKRQFIWDAFVPAVKEKIFFGHGNEMDLYTFSRFRYAPMAHNFILGIAYSGGIIGVLSFIGFIIWLAYKKRNDIGTMYYYICTVSILAFLVGSLTETWEMMEAIPVLFALLFSGERIFEGELEK